MKTDRPRPMGALTEADLKIIENLSISEKRQLKLYWLRSYNGDHEIVSEKVLYTHTLTHNEYHLHLDWGGYFFDNYWLAYAYALKHRKSHS